MYRATARLRTISIQHIVCVTAAAVALFAAAPSVHASSAEYDCREAAAIQFSDNEDQKTLVWNQAVGTVAMFRNLLCFVSDPRCSCLSDIIDSDSHRRDEFRFELDRSVARCHAENPDRTLSGATQDAAKTICKNRSTCIDQAKIDPDAICPQVVDPVCGCDHQQYSNSCEAQASGVTSWDEGPCTGTCIDSSKIDEHAVCAQVFDPVCGCDGKTYSNSCEALNSGITSTTPGSCGDKCFDPSLVDPSGNCLDVEIPVCGCDGMDYGNACVALNEGVTFWDEGRCRDACTDPSKIDPGAICPQVVDPVCGCDGQEYDNSCRAQSSGVTDWHDGSCVVL